MTTNEPNRIAEWLTTNPETALQAAAEIAQHRIPGHLGVCVAAVLKDHGRDAAPDPNIHELAYELLRVGGSGGGES